MRHRKDVKLVVIILLMFASLRFTFSQTQTQTQTQPQSQPVPSTDIFLADISDGKITGEPQNITKREGYDNQPYFLPGSTQLFYTSIADNQADIYRYDLKSGKTERFTRTPESEYSTSITPDNNNISVVRVEQDQTQRLWAFPLNGEKPFPVLRKIKPVGYYLWIDSNTVVAFVLGEPNTLQLIDTQTESARIIAKDIGRCLQRVPGKKQFTFVQMEKDNPKSIQLFDLNSNKASFLVAALPGSEDYVWLPSGTLLSGKGSKLFSFNPAHDKEWKEISDFASDHIKAISRLAVDRSETKLAIVSEE